MDSLACPVSNQACHQPALALRCMGRTPFNDIGTIVSPLLELPMQCHEQVAVGTQDEQGLGLDLGPGSQA